jgi:NAD(P)-dependent dehydrogenase (short-subunit alcohol dehydrogenase family)
MTQRVLITAGANGIGLAIARSFAADGAQVHVCDIDEDAIAKTVAGSDRITGSIADVTDESAVQRLLAEVDDRFGGLDVLVNNAGVSGPTAPVESYDRNGWRSVLDVNLNGTFFVTQEAIPLLKRAAQRDGGHGSIIVMSSLAGRFGYANRIGYATTKWGLIGFMKTLSLELGTSGITCNAILPGAVEGARIQSVMQGRSSLSGRSIDEEMQLALANQSVKRFVDPVDIAALVRFLAGPHGRSISGQSFPIDGDSKAAQ